LGEKLVLKFKDKSKKVILLMIVILFLAGSFAPLIQGLDADVYNGFDKGPSNLPVVPMKKVTFVNFDEDSYLDDYAYLASIPTAVFNYDEKLYSNPLLFYQDEHIAEDKKELSLNARQGIDYFMQDWMGYCNGQMDTMTTINVPKNKLDSSWKAKNIVEIESKNPYELSSKIALSQWSYSNDVVIAVIDEEFEKPQEEFRNVIGGILLAADIKDDITFDIKQTNKLNPQFRDFNIPDGYKYVDVRAWWASIDIPLEMLYSHIIIPTGDKDIQLFCLHEDNWMQVAAAATCNVQSGMDPESERAKSYVYSSGSWRVGLTDLPTKKIVHGSVSGILANILKGVTYHVDVKMYPGVDVIIPENPPYECTDVEFKLVSDAVDVNLGLSLIGPGGEEVKSIFMDDNNNELKLNLDELGQCLDNENYKLCVFSTQDLKRSVDFKIEYSWKQRINIEEGNSLTSAVQGAVLASQLNAPLLYVTKSNFPKSISDTLYKLGTKNIFLVDIGENLQKETSKQISEVAKIKNYYTEEKDIFKAIRDITNSNDVIFTTIDPWTYWYVTELQPADEYDGALFIGPAAYIAAHHGAPVLIVDNHPKLSSSVVWHNEFWKENSDKRTDFLPSVSEMYLTGMRVYDFLKEYDFDQAGAETLITIADQFDIGTSWDRVFPGRANPGRIWGTPVDTAHIISRNIFYPVLIFENPAMDQNGVKLINGSKSVRRFPYYGPLGLKITRESQEEEYNYPILHTYVCYAHRLNEMFEKYYGETYQFANEIIAGKTNSFNPIDDGVNLKYRGEDGSFHPDLIDSELTALYASRGGYSNAFSTSFDAVMHNLNQGAIMWIHDGHGLAADSGQGLFWSQIPGTGSAKEENPWRLYEWYLGSTENPDTMTMDVHGVIPALLGNPTRDGIFRTGLAWAPARKPILDKIADILNRPFLFPVISYLSPDWLKDKEDYYDGMVNTVFPSTLNSEFRTGYEIDEKLDNLHSCGYITANCLASNTYFHLSLIRHGSPYQIMDPWSTSWYSSAWIQSIPRDIALGDTIGEAYVKGIKTVGILYISDPPQWWWDIAENVVFFGDPDLRPFVPSTTYSNNNYWTRDETQPIRYNAELSINGNMPFGVTSYPYAREKPELIFGMPLVIFVLLLVIILLVIVIAFIGRKKK
jgi:hypothetical protein